MASVSPLVISGRNPPKSCNAFRAFRGLILGRGFVPEPSSFAVKSLVLGVRELKIQSLGFGVREQKKL